MTTETTPAAGTETAVTEKPAVTEAAAQAAPATAAATPATETTATPAEKPATIAAGAEKPETVQTAPAFPEDWREQWGAGDKDAEAILKRIPSPAELVKKLVNQEKLIKSAEHKKPAELPKDATEEQIAAFRKEKGVPDKPEEYLEKLELPNGVVLGDADKPIALDYAAFAHQNNMTPAEVSKNMAWYYQLQEKMLAEQAKFDDTKQTETITALKGEWGGNYEKNRTAVMNLLNATAPKSIHNTMLEGRLPDGRKFGDHPEVMKWLAHLSYEMTTADNTLVPGSGYAGKGVDGRLGELKTLMKDRQSEYYKGPNAQKLQAEYRELIDLQNKSKSRAA
jgi:hypothetical protein